MTGGQIWALVKGALVAFFGVFTASRIKSSGRNEAERDEARRDRDAAQAKADRMSKPIKTPSERQAAARRELERRRGLRDSAGRH